MDLVRALGLAGIRSAVVTARGTAASFSRYCSTTVDPTGPAPLVEVLLAFASSQPERPVLFYESDEDATLLAENFDRLSSAFRFVFPGPELVMSLLDKGRFDELARRLDLPVPRARIVRPEVDEPPPDFPFPAVLKPVPYRSDEWDALRGRHKVAVCENRDELAGEWPSLSDAGTAVLLQELVPGPESQVVSYHAYVDAGGATVGEFTGRKLRTYPRHYGHSTALVTTDDTAVREAGREVLRRIGFRGVAKVDFKRGPDGRLHLLEINPRFSLWAHLGAVAGANLPALVHADLTGTARPSAQARPGVTWCRLRDRAAARQEGIGTLRWLRWAVTCDANSTGFAWDDPLPFFKARAARFARRHRRRPVDGHGEGRTGGPR